MIEVDIQSIAPTTDAEMGGEGQDPAGPSPQVGQEVEVALRARLVSQDGGRAQLEPMSINGSPVQGTTTADKDAGAGTGPEDLDEVEDDLDQQYGMLS